MSTTEVSFANFTSSRQMVTQRVKTAIISLIHKAHYAYQNANQFANAVLRQEQIAINLWRDITRLIYPYNQRLQQELFNQGLQNLQNNVERIGSLLASGTVDAILKVSKTFNEQIESGKQYIHNVLPNIREATQNTNNARLFQTLNIYYERYQNMHTTLSFHEFLRGRPFSESEITSFLNSRGGAQDGMARGAHTYAEHRIVPHTNGQGQVVPYGGSQTTGISPIGDAMQNVYNSLNTNAPNTPSPTTTTQTPTTEAPTPMERAVGAGPTSGGAHGETGVEMINYTKFHPFKRTEQVLMPFYTSSTLTYPANATSAVAITFRLNSIYDIIHANASFVAIDPNTTPVTADQADVGPNIKEVPMMREYWKQFYSYWHVVKCEWKFSYLPKLINMSTNVQNQLFFYEHGIQYPPLTQTVAGTAKLIPWHVRQYHPHVRQKTIINHGADIQLHSNWQSVSGTWRPGDIQHEVAEDEFTRVWHKFEQVPPTAEKLTIMLQSMDGQPADPGNYIMPYKMEMHYTVQLKDLKAQYEFITEATGVPAVAEFTQRVL